MESTTYRYRCTESNILSSLNLENLTRENMWFYSRVINTANKFFVSELKIGMNCLIDFIIRINSFNQKKFFLPNILNFFFRGNMEKFEFLSIFVYFLLNLVLRVACVFFKFPVLFYTSLVIDILLLFCFGVYVSILYCQRGKNFKIGPS